MFGLGASYALGEENKSLYLCNQDIFLNQNKKHSSPSFPFLFVKDQNSYFGVHINSTFPIKVKIKKAAHKNKSQQKLLFYIHEGDQTPFDFFIMTGCPKDIMNAYIKLFGEACLPPLWSIGFHQSRWSYKNEKEVLEIARKMRHRSIPCDAIYLDTDQTRDKKVFSWDFNRFPKPVRMNQRLEELGFKSVVNVKPIALLDLTDPKASDWSRNLHHFYLKSGVSGILYGKRNFSILRSFPMYAKKKETFYLD